jgi:hypothetical protein
MHLQFALPFSPVVLKFALDVQNDETHDDTGSEQEEGKRRGF